MSLLWRTGLLMSHMLSLPTFVLPNRILQMLPQSVDFLLLFLLINVNMLSLVPSMTMVLIVVQGTINVLIPSFLEGSIAHSA